MDEPSTSTGKRGRFEKGESSDESDENFSTSDFESGEENIYNLDSDSSNEDDDVSDSESSDNDRWDDRNFRWEDCDAFQPEMYYFDDTNSGVTDLFTVADDAEEYEYFTKFFDINLMNVIVNETNRYYEYCTREQNDIIRSRTKRWVSTTVDEMYSFLALILLMPQIKKGTISDYWSKNPMIRTDFFSKYMSRDRFTQILRYIHFTDNDNPLENDRLWKIRNVFDNIINKFTTFFSPFQKLCIDESLVLYKGRLRFKQYIPSKRHRFGLKLFLVCDCETGIIMNVLVYSGSARDIPQDDPIGVSGAVVKKLIDNYQRKNHVLYTDNWYTSPKLAVYLVQNGIGLCGTVKKNRKHFPPFTALRRGEIKLKMCRKVLALKWKDKRDVHFITTFHRGRLVDSGKVDYRTNEIIMKPDCVVDYTKNMRLVDKADMQLSFVECVRKTVKWYKKFFFHLLDLSILNSYNLYLVKTGNNSLPLKQFIRNIIRQLLERHGTLTAVRFGRRSGEHLDRLSAMNFMERHFLDNVPPTAARRKGQRICHVCSNTTRGDRKRKYVTTWCPECEVGLCVGSCYRIYHTRKNF